MAAGESGVKMKVADLGYERHPEAMFVRRRIVGPA